MKHILFAFVILFFASPGYAAQTSENPPPMIEPSAGDVDLDNPFNCVSEQHSEWLRCKANSDCVVVNNACGHPQLPASVAFQEMVGRCAKVKASPSMDCVNDDKLNGSTSYTAECFHGLCRARTNR